MRLRVIGLAIITAAALLGVSADVAFATSSNHATSGVEHYWVSGFGPTGGPSQFVGTGLFTDAGSLNKGTVTLSKGGFQVDTSNIIHKHGINMNTCFVDETYGGTIRLYGGTGAYTGISGTLPIGGHVVFVFGRLRNGRCAILVPTPTAIGEAGLVSGSGKVRLGR